MAFPLRGLRVLDLTRILAGPWCTMLLGDAGASVIKLERPPLGDDTRSWGPPFVGANSKKKESTYFLSVNRNKKSLAVNLKTSQGRAICHRLATSWADVVVENFKVGTMEAMGLGYEATLRRENPGLVYCSITGFGSTGPYRNRPGYDVIVSGMYGLMSITGDPEGAPAKVGVAITDILTGSLAHGAILAALYERNRTGLGQRVETSLMETQLASLVNIASSSLNSAPGTKPPQRWGTAHESIVPYQAFLCRPPSDEDVDCEDQYIVVGAGNDTQFVKLCDALGVPELASTDRDDTTDRFATNAERVANRSRLISILEGIFATKTRDEWMSRLEGKGFPVGPVRTVPEAFECEQATHRGMVMELDHPAVAPPSKIRLPRSPITYAAGAGQDDSGRLHDDRQHDHPTVLPPPMLGEHTDEILRNILKMSTNEVKQLEANGVIQCWRRGESNGNASQQPQ